MSLRFAYHSTILAAAVLALSACNKNADNAVQPTPTATSAPAAQPAAAPTAQAIAASTLPSAALDGAKQGGHCALDAIDGAGNLTPANPTSVKAGQTFIAGGWLMNSAMQSPSKFTLILQGAQTYGFDGATGGLRPDVAKAWSADAAAQSGFNITANLGNTPAGTYKILALIKGQNGNEICDMQHQVTISN